MHSATRQNYCIVFNTTESDTAATFDFPGLPREIRDEIYRIATIPLLYKIPFIAVPPSRTREAPDKPSIIKGTWKIIINDYSDIPTLLCKRSGLGTLPVLSLVNRQIYNELQATFFERATFEITVLDPPLLKSIQGRTVVSNTTSSRPRNVDIIRKGAFYQSFSDLVDSILEVRHPLSL